MSKLKSMTENRYTLNDIFTKNYQYWLAAPLFIYLLTPVVHMIVYALLYSDTLTSTADAEYDPILHYMNTGEWQGDYYSAIIQFSFIISAFVAAVALISYFAWCRQNAIRQTSDWIPMCFFAVYGFLIVISTVINKTTFNYIFGLTARAEGVIEVIGYFLVFYLCGSLIRNEKIKYAAICFFLATGTVIGILSLINLFVTDIGIIKDDTLSAIFYHHNFYAYYLSITIALCVALFSLSKKKAVAIVSFILFCFNSFILAVNDSLGGFIASIVSMVFLAVAFAIKRKKFPLRTVIAFAVFLAIVFVTGLFTPSFFSELTKLGSDVERIITDSENAGDAGTARWTLWVHTAKYIKEKPLFGWGFEGIADRLGTETHADKTHNEYLENMAYYGIPAGVLYVLGLISVYVKALIRHKKVDDVTLVCLTGAFAYIASAFVGNAFIFIAPFFFIFLGLANNTHGQYPEPERVTDNTGEAVKESENPETTPEIPDKTVEEES
ncbi:MAG: O-antigen ligase family protein [Clostridia bacterium]|nr:O-antigen ligase family protein [Clostridia bacterium]